MMKVSPSEQARRDREKSKQNPIKSFKDMTPEEQEQVKAEIEAQDRSRAKRQAKAALGRTGL